MAGPRRVDAHNRTGGGVTAVRSAVILAVMRRMTSILLGSALLISLPGGAALAAEAPCELAVSPTSGPPGTEFVFSGSGYTPTQLTLRQKGADPRVVDLDLDSADPFEIPFVATEADAGRWSVTASIPETECAGRAVVDVTLPPTSSLAEVTATPATGLDRGVLFAGFAAMVAIFALAAGVIMSRLARRA